MTAGFVFLFHLLPQQHTLAIVTVKTKANMARIQRTL